MHYNLPDLFLIIFIPYLSHIIDIMTFCLRLVKAERIAVNPRPGVLILTHL